jgi:hypothetical protein
MSLSKDIFEASIKNLIIKLSGQAVGPTHFGNQSSG